MATAAAAYYLKKKKRAKLQENSYMGVFFTENEDELPSTYSSAIYKLKVLVKTGDMYASTDNDDIVLSRQRRKKVQNENFDYSANFPPRIDIPLNKLTSLMERKAAAGSFEEALSSTASKSTSSKSTASKSTASTSTASKSTASKSTASKSMGPFNLVKGKQPMAESACSSNSSINNSLVLEKINEVAKAISGVEERQSELMGIVENTALNVQSIARAMENRQPNQFDAREPEDLIPILEKIPVNSNQDFDAVEVFLEDARHRKLLTRKLCSNIPASANKKEIIESILTQLIDDSYIFNGLHLHGKDKTKKKIAGTWVYTIIRAAFAERHIFVEISDISMAYSKLRKKKYDVLRVRNESTGTLEGGGSTIRGTPDNGSTIRESPDNGSTIRVSPDNGSNSRAPSSDES